MKIENANDYLKYRAVVLSNEHTELTKSYEDNKILMTEVRKKIDEIKNVVDEGFEMFSPKAAQEKSFNKQEVKELQMRLLLLVDDCKEIENKIKIVNDELIVVNQLLNIQNEGNGIDINKNKLFGNVNKTIDENFYDKIKFCADISELDPRRVKIELEKMLE